MKVLIDLTSLYDKISGIERFTLNIARELLEADYENEYTLIFKKEIHSDFKKFENRDNIKTVCINVDNKILLSQIVLPYYLYKSKCDLNIFMAFPSPLLFIGKNEINAVHDMTAWRFPETMGVKGYILFKVLIDKAIKTSRKIITVSNFSKGEIQHYYPSADPFVIYNGVNECYFNYNNDNKNQILSKYSINEKYILTVGTVEPRKNLSLLIKAFVQLKKEENIPHKLVITGRKGWKYDDILSWVHEEKMENEIVFTGFIDEDDLPCIYKNSEFFVFPSKYEGFGIPPIEAMAAGTLTVVSDIDVLKEITRDKAITFRNNDLGDLKEVMKKLLVDGIENKELLIKEAKDVASSYNWKLESLKLLNLINTLLK